MMSPDQVHFIGFLRQSLDGVGMLGYGSAPTEPFELTLEKAWENCLRYRVDRNPSLAGSFQQAARLFANLIHDKLAMLEHPIDSQSLKAIEAQHLAAAHLLREILLLRDAMDNPDVQPPRRSGQLCK